MSDSETKDASSNKNKTIPSFPTERAISSGVFPEAGIETVT